MTLVILSVMLKALSITLVVFSALAVIVALLFEGELKAKKEEKRFLNLTGVGLSLLSIFVITSSLNGYISIKNITDNETKSYQDSVRFANKAYDDSISATINLVASEQIIEDLKTKRKQDSTEVMELKSDIRRIDTTLVKNAIEALEEQRKTVELERQNIFLHLQMEVKENLSNILIFYNDKDVRSDIDSNKFTTVRLNCTYIKQYGYISMNQNIIDYFMNTSTQIEETNKFANKVLETDDKKLRLFRVGKFILNKEGTYKFLIAIWNKIYNIKNYKEFESVNFNSNKNIFNRSQLSNELTKDFLNKTKLE